MPFLDLEPLRAHRLAARMRRSAIRVQDQGAGFDVFGMHADQVRRADALAAPLYDVYFRVRSLFATENLPKEGPAIVVANHGGTLPFDAVLLWADILRHTDPPRAARPIADHFVSAIPFFSTFMQRCGVIGGSRFNVDAALARGEMLIVFPEGTPGITKPFSQRYQLQRWRHGHCELAIRHGAPIVPASIVGMEEQMPHLFRVPGFRRLGPKWLPIPMVPVPLPTQCTIRYGEPIEPIGSAEEVARRCRMAVRALLDASLSDRKGWFR